MPEVPPKAVGLDRVWGGFRLGFFFGGGGAGDGKDGRGMKRTGVGGCPEEDWGPGGEQPSLKPFSEPGDVFPAGGRALQKTGGSGARGLGGFPPLC